eukprot:TRINITY_DN5121_c0_g1_i1.p1 TRINITY_DN5121_c0_g1~~TRINITY_DN5121_c0_g1_i1.p1  ORF type:complete len:308 (+),score=36.90 TRINITY_DN5121_c0_g1_i1:92-925(+)
MLQYKNKSALDRVYFLKKAKEIFDIVPLMSSIELLFHANAAVRTTNQLTLHEYEEINQHYDQLVKCVNSTKSIENFDMNIIRAIISGNRAFFAYKAGNIREAGLLAASCLEVVQTTKWGHNPASFLLAFVLPLCLEVNKSVTGVPQPNALDIIGPSAKFGHVLKNLVTLSWNSYNLPLSPTNSIPSTAVITQTSSAELERVPSQVTNATSVNYIVSPTPRRYNISITPWKTINSSLFGDGPKSTYDDFKTKREDEVQGWENYPWRSVSEKLTNPNCI